MPAVWQLDDRGKDNGRKLLFSKSNGPDAELRGPVGYRDREIGKSCLVNIGHWWKLNFFKTSAFLNLYHSPRHIRESNPLNNVEFSLDVQWLKNL